ncbi:L-glyceraldehyde 3-phosphate reductase [Fulvitalea axinellae]|uniref:L-glyceraldehyde 3-phosphate reductase n=1 Tax=Fulvitalea axinellae TaxID=1182444 RepID=A0AAU9CM53_9BACT|nr:L-glyceraldehyde 3-phosphate reductase [Fulvitalea axinellae]
MTYSANIQRYQNMSYPRIGQSGLRLSELSLGLWHNFGGVDAFENGRQIVLKAFDKGITHFDLANNYGPPAGSAEETFGRIMAKDLAPYRNELVISTKAGHDMWPGPYGDGGNRKYMLASLDDSLQRMGLEYVDIFYSHRFDPETPLEETLYALDTAVRQGKAMYVGISKYNPEQTEKAVEILSRWNTPFIIHQERYSMLDRHMEEGLTDTLDKHGLGCIVFSPLAQGLLTDKYLKGIPENSRAAKSTGYLQKDQVTPELVEQLRQLNNLAMQRGQSLAQMAIAWNLRLPTVTSVLVGASRVEQLENNLLALDNKAFTNEELLQIEQILKG